MGHDPKSFPDKTILFDCVALEQVELKQVLGELNIHKGCLSRAQKIRRLKKMLQESSHSTVEVAQGEKGDKWAVSDSVEQQIVSEVVPQETTKMSLKGKQHEIEAWMKELKKEKESKAEVIKPAQEQCAEMFERKEALEKAMATFRESHNSEEALQSFGIIVGSSCSTPMFKAARAIYWKIGKAISLQQEPATTSHQT
ncbi:hypothetical protein GIB67_011731 [Kingdonia uniflora]|uniref:Uncharacterized protein n=1 Tax=Kingdonia uniflora TaxID=39325 RepID=A0A7J7LUK1_9MAGN|nr:hypothetical protein GIB67_011731 [Kingdonia uniflora]